MRALVFIVFGLLTAVAQAGTIGWCPTTSNNVSAISNSSPQYLTTQPNYVYTPSEAEVVTEVSIYASSCHAPNRTPEVAVYDVTNGTDSNATLVGSAAITCPSSAQQLCTATGLEWSLSAGRDYAVAFKNSGPNSCSLERTWGGSSNQLSSDRTGADPFGANWTDNVTTEGWDHEICAQTEAAPAGGVVIYRRRRQ